MKQKILVSLSTLITVCALFGMIVLYAPASAQDAPPVAPSTYDIEAIYRAQVTAINEGDLEAAVQYYAEDAISIALPPPPGVDPVVLGNEALRVSTAEFIALNSHIEFTDFHVNGETATYRTITTADFLTDLGVGYLRFSGTAIFRKGLIVSETALMDKESQDRLEAALTLQANKAIVGRIYDEFFNQGEMGAADEILDPEVTVSFTGNTGIEAFKEDINFFRTVYPDIKLEYSDVVAEGEIVVVTISGSGTYQGGFEFLGIPASAIGKKVTWTGTDYTRIVNGKVVEVWGVHDDLPWFQQLGLKLVPEGE